MCSALIDLADDDNGTVRIILPTLGDECDIDNDTLSGNTDPDDHNVDEVANAARVDDNDETNETVGAL